MNKHAEVLQQIAKLHPELMSIEAVARAVDFAAHKHRNQQRKYTYEPYIFHPVAVAQTLLTYSGIPIEEAREDEDFQKSLITAVLHDTVEDTDCTFNDIEKNFGEDIAVGVWWLTDETSKQKGNRAIRKLISNNKVRHAPAPIQFIKLCDVLQNVGSVAEHDADFAEVYLEEKLEQCSAIVTSDNFTIAGAENDYFNTAVLRITRDLDAIFHAYQSKE
jgi:(p)ppGpp synthase/HD superfamily hydrolase